MTWEHSLINRIISAGDIVPALERKITVDWFEDEEHARVWEFLVYFFHRYGEVPSARTVKQNFPNYRLIRQDDPYEAILDAAVLARRRILTTEMVYDLNEALQRDALDEVQHLASSWQTRLATEVTALRDTDLVQTAEQRLEYYRMLEERGTSMLGLPTGFQVIDEATAGLQPEQLVTLIATPKTGKSLIALAVAKHVFLQGKKPLFIGFEMSNSEQESRFDAMLAGVSRDALVRGTLSPTERRRLQRALRRLKEHENSFVLSSDIDRATTISGVQAKIEQHKPDLVVIDGSYMMIDEQGEPPNSPQALTNITRGLKRVAQTTRTPIFNTTQALVWKTGRNGRLSQNSVGYSSSFAQDSDVLMGLEREGDDAELRRLRIIEARNCGPKEVLIRINWDDSTIEELGAPEDPEDPDDDLKSEDQAARHFQRAGW